MAPIIERVRRLFRRRRQTEGLAQSPSRLMQKLAGGGPTERRDAVLALAAAGRQPWEVVPPLVLALRDPAPDVRVAAADALGDVGAGEAVACLTRALADPEQAVSDAAAEAIRRITGERPERRQAQRVRVELRTAVQVGRRGAQLSGEIRDLSVSGLFLTTALPWPMAVGARLRLSLTLAGPVAVQAEVVRLDPLHRGVGCRFVEAGQGRDLWRRVHEPDPWSHARVALFLQADFA